MSSRKEINKIEQRVKRDNVVLDTLMAARLLCGKYNYIILFISACRRSFKTLNSYFISKVYRPSASSHDLIYDESEFPVKNQKQRSIKRYLEMNVLLTELENCGIEFTWRRHSNETEYKLRDITFTRMVPVLWNLNGQVLDIWKMRETIGMQTYNMFQKTYQNICYCLINNHNYHAVIIKKDRTVKGFAIEDLCQVFVVEEENLELYVIENK